MTDRELLYCSIRSVPAPDIQCPDCGYDAMLRVNLTWLLDMGVRTDAHEWCGRCRAEADRG